MYKNTGFQNICIKFDNEFLLFESNWAIKRIIDDALDMANNYYLWPSKAWLVAGELRSNLSNTSTISVSKYILSKI